jgi:hypothetical protein
MEIRKEMKSRRKVPLKMRKKMMKKSTVANLMRKDLKMVSMKKKVNIMIQSRSREYLLVRNS